MKLFIVFAVLFVSLINVSYGKTKIDVKKLAAEFSKMTVPQLKERIVSDTAKITGNTEARIAFYKKEGVHILEKHSKNFLTWGGEALKKLMETIDKTEGQVKLVNFIKLGVAVDFLYLSLDDAKLPEHIKLRDTVPNLTKQLKASEDKLLKALKDASASLRKVHQELWASVHDELYKFFDGDFKITHEGLKNLKEPELGKTLQAAIDLDDLIFVAANTRNE